MIDEHLRGAEIVLCNRLKRSDSLLSRLTSGFAYSMLRKRVPEIPPGGFDVFLFSSRVKESLLDLPGRFSFLQGDLLNLGFKVSTVGFHRSNRPFGKSGYTFSKKLQTFFDAIIDTSYGLIQYVVRIGFLISVFGIALAGYVILGKFLHRDPFSGFALIASSVLIIGGIQIALIGLVGEYVWRIYDISRRRPNFIIEENLP
jgi:dolichol-phosphate mannosyltransferase